MDCVDHKVTLPTAEIYEGVENSPIPKKDISEKSYVTSKYQIQWIRERISTKIHHHYFQIFVCILVLLDTAVVVTEIMIETSNTNGEHHNSDIELAERILHYTSLSILTFFMLEIATKIFAMGFSFFKHKLEIFDAVIVSVSFFLDIFLSPGGIKDGVEFLVLLRLWRITRIINGKPSRMNELHLITREDFTTQWVNNSEITH